MQILFFTFLFIFVIRGLTAKKKMCDNNFNVSKIWLIRPIELFQRISVNIELNTAETNLSDECFIEANLEYRQTLSSMDFLKFSTMTMGRKILKATNRILVEFECWHFVVPGSYRISFSNFISLSTEWIQIKAPNLAIQIHLPPVTAIFPSCQNDFSISWTLPTCEKLRELVDFRLRLLAPVMETKNNDEMLYLEEFLLAESNLNDKLLQNLFLTNFLRIPCTKVFDIIHEQFCFELVSISKQYGGQHQLWDTKCLSTETATAQMNDGEHWEWSEWSEWAKCLCRRKETNGIRKRTRYCRRSNANLLERTTVGTFKTASKTKAFGTGGGCRGGRGGIMQREKCEQRKCRNNDALTLAASLVVIGQSIPNFTSNILQQEIAKGNVSLFQCFCGCKLPEQPQGMFFASLCPDKSAQRWELEFGRPFRVQITVSNRLEDESPLTFEIIRDNGGEKFYETLWNSQNNPRKESENGIIEGIFEKVAIFELKSATDAAMGSERFEFVKNQKQKKRSDEFGILVEYKIIAFEEVSTKNLFAELLYIGRNITLISDVCHKRNIALCSILLGLCSLFLLLIAAFMPPIAFVFIAKRHTKKRMTQQLRQIYHFRADSVENNSSALFVSTHCHKQIDGELIRSDGGTDSTKLSNSLVISAKRKSPLTETHQLIANGKGIAAMVEQRSIGIQLSRHSTPRCVSRQLRPRRRRSSSNCNGLQASDRSNGSIETATIGDQSNQAEDYWNEDDDFGAEQLQLGVRMAAESAEELVSDIDIDAIVVRREASNAVYWKKANSKVAMAMDQKDASTQLLSADFIPNF